MFFLAQVNLGKNIFLLLKFLVFPFFPIFHFILLLKWSDQFRNLVIVKQNRIKYLEKYRNFCSSFFLFLTIYCLILKKILEEMNSIERFLVVNPFSFATWKIFRPSYYAFQILIIHCSQIPFAKLSISLILLCNSLFFKVFSLDFLWFSIIFVFYRLQF